MRKSKKFARAPVISLKEGRQIGAVKGIIVDHAAKKVAALIIEQKGFFKEQRFIPFHKIHSVGNDAVTIEEASGVERAAGLPDIVKLLKDKVGIIGAKIVAENGSVLGFVDEYYVDLSSGTIAGLEFSGNFINSVIKGRAFLDISYVRTLGKEVVVVTNESINDIFKLDGGLQDAVKGIRESTGHFLESTVQKTRDLGAGISKSLEKVKKDKKTGLWTGDEQNLSSEGGTPDQEPERPGRLETPVENKADGMNAPPEISSGEAVPPPSGSNGEARKDVNPPV